MCTGNAARSFAAQALLNARAKSEGLDFEADSCGVAAQPFYQVPPQVSDFLQKEGVVNSAHHPKLITEELVDWADIVLVMENWHYEAAADMFPENIGKLRLLKTCCPGVADEKADIPDPAGQSDKFYSRVLGEIKNCIDCLIKKPRP